MIDHNCLNSQKCNPGKRDRIIIICIGIFAIILSLSVLPKISVECQAVKAEFGTYNKSKMTD